jgi:hypothetical protein
MKASLVINPSHKIRKTKTQCMHNVNAKIFNYKNMTITKQDYDKNIYPKLLLNILQVMWDSTFIYVHWTPSSKKLFKNFHLTCGTT